jgi:branched-subunit amino acid ABC-type transport system permease component
MDMFIQSLVNGVTGSLILILIASGLCLIFGIMHIVNFAHGEFFMLGDLGRGFSLPGNRSPSLNRIICDIFSQ